MKSTPSYFVGEFQRRVGLDDDEDPGGDTYAALDRILPPIPKVTVKPSQAAIPVAGSLETKLAAAIIANARRFCGLKEIRSNANWDNPDTKGPDSALVAELLAGMRSAPWQEGWAYCAAYVEFVVVLGLKNIGSTPEQIDRFRAVMSPGVMNSVRAFREIGRLSPAPVPGAMWLARHGTSDQGHAGVVVLPHAPNMDTIEGNTSYNSDGNQREGDWITNRIRPVAGIGDLRTQGFVHPISVLKICGIIQ